MMEKEFLEKYELVFDEEGEIKKCGRTLCKELISIANKLDDKTNYGNIKTGFLNIANIKNLYNDLRERV